MTRTLKTIVVAAALAAPLSVHSSAQGSFLDLGALSPQGSPEIDDSRAWDISDDGRTVVGSFVYGDFSSLVGGQFRWHAASGMTNLGPANGSEFGSARRVTGDGTVILGTLAYPIAQTDEPSIWDPASGLRELDPTGFLDDVSGVGLSSDGDRVFVNGDGGTPLRVTRSTGVFEFVQPPGSASRLFLRACDDSGTVAVGLAESSSAITKDAVIWTESLGSMILPMSPLGDDSQAVDVSPDGSLVLGTTWTIGTSSRSTWLYEVATGTTTVIATHGSNQFPLRISADGGVVLYGNGAIWTPSTGETSLEALLAASGATPPAGATSILPTAVSPNGQSFAGYFVTGQGHFRAFVAYLAEPEAQEIGASVCPSVVPNSTASEGQLEARGSVIAADNDVRLIASELPLNATTLFLNSPMSSFVPAAGGSLGNLCLGGNIGRYYSGVTTSGPSGTADLSLDLTQTPRPTSVIAIVAGETWFFQAWHRDLNPGGVGSNFTDAVTVEFQ